MKTNSLLFFSFFLIIGSTAPEQPSAGLLECHCSPYEPLSEIPEHRRLALVGNQEQVQEYLTEWEANGGKPQQIQELILANGALITPELSRFSEVKKLRFQSQFDLPLGDLTRFPNLEMLVLENSIMSEGEKIDQVLGLKHLELIKSQLKGEASAQGVRSLRTLRIHFGSWGKGFLPLGFGKCLEEISINGMTAGKIGLNTVDFSQLSCLKRVYINDTFGSITGFPKNWDAHRMSFCRFVNMKWTQAQQEIYKRYRK
ncbi:MAG: hypothetical protein AAFR61_24225 [Bacteroidota bacterium]